MQIHTLTKINSSRESWRCGKELDRKSKYSLNTPPSLRAVSIVHVHVSASRLPPPAKDHEWSRISTPGVLLLVGRERLGTTISLLNIASTSYPVSQELRALSSRPP